MGLDLVLLPFDGDDFSQTVLPVYEDREVYDDLLGEQAWLGRDVPDNFRCLLGTNIDSGETCYSVVTEDCYGEPIKRLKAKELVEIFNRYDPEDLNPKTLAALAYLEKLPPRHKVALFWK